MEKSPARVTRDLSAPWLRHSGRDDGLGVVHRARRSFDYRFVIAPLSCDCRFAIAPLSCDCRFAITPSSFRLEVLYHPFVISIVGSAGTGMEKSPARVTRDLSAPWLRHSGRDDGLGGVHHALGHSTADSLSLPCLFDWRFRRNRNGEISCSR